MDRGSAFPAADVRAVFATSSSRSVDVEGRQAHVLAGDTDFPEPRPSVRLLPEYDVYVMGFREREQLVPDAVREQIAATAAVATRYPPVFASSRRRRRRRHLAAQAARQRIELTISPARKLTKPQRAELAAEAERIGACTGLEPLVTVL